MLLRPASRLALTRRRCDRQAALEVGVAEREEFLAEDVLPQALQKWRQL
jgi:hypothetical protein